MMEGRKICNHLVAVVVPVVVGISACIGPATPIAPQVAPTIETAPSPESPTALTVQQAEPQPTVGPDLSIPGLQLVYLRDGNLWMLRDGGESVQMTGAGDLTTAAFSADGGTLAMIRNDEIWTVSLDGSQARMLGTQTEAAALRFSPSGAWLSVSTTERIDLIDMSTADRTTLLTYPPIENSSIGFFPEVVWSPDSSGFKTVVPGQGVEPSQLLYVFTNGTVASLAQFDMLPISESIPFLSPDGGYLIYAAPLGDGQKSLYLMDASGAARPYGEPAGGVRAMGWLPDSRRFVYGTVGPQAQIMGGVDNPPVAIPLEEYDVIRWLDSESFLALRNGVLSWGNLSGARTPLDEGVTDFDFVK